MRGCDQLRFPGLDRALFWDDHSFGSENQVRLDSGQTFFQQHLQAKVRFHSHYGSHFRSQKGLRIISRAMLRRGKILRCEASFGGRQWSMGHDGSRWVTTSMVWHPNDPFKNKIHENPSKKKHTKNIKDIIKHHLFQLCSYADWPLPTGCAASQCVVLVWEDGAVPCGRKSVTGPHIGPFLDVNRPILTYEVSNLDPYCQF